MSQKERTKGGDLLIVNTVTNKAATSSPSRLAADRKDKTMTHSQRIAYCFRKVLLVVWLLCLVAGLVWMLLPFWFESFMGLSGTPQIALWFPLYEIVDLGEILSSGPLYIATIFLYCGLFLCTQWMFLSTRRHWQIKTAEQGRPLRRTAVSAAFMVSLLLTGLLYSLLDLVNEKMIYGLPDSTSPFRHAFYMIPLLLWFAWSIVFFIYLKKHDFNTFTSKLLRGLFAGSLLELFVSVPVYATHQEECHCARGSYAGLIFGATVLLWAFGPGVIFLFLREKNRQQKLDNTESKH